MGVRVCVWWSAIVRTQWTLMLLLALVCPWPTSRAAGGAATASSADEIAALARQLGDDDFDVRERATQRLQDIGKPALEELKRAAGSEDPEVRGRAQMLVRRIERHPIPGWDRRMGADGGIVGRNVHVIIGEDSKTVEVSQGAMRIRIAQRAGEVEVSVTANEEGKEVTETYRGRDADELKRLSPEAHELLDRWGGGPGRRWMLRVAGSNIVVDDGEFHMRSVVLEDELSIYRGRLDGQLRDAGTPEDQRRWLRDHLDKMQAVQRSRDAGAPDDRQQANEQYLKLVDELRDKLAELKLPDPGTWLPPGAKARLGVALRPPDPDGDGPDGLTIMDVTAGARGEKLGMKVGDIVRRVKGQAVKTIHELRRAVMECKGPLEVDVERDGQEIKLSEKP